MYSVYMPCLPHADTGIITSVRDFLGGRGGLGGVDKLNLPAKN